MERITLTIRMPTELKTKLDQISKERGISINAIIVDMLWNKMQQI